MIIQLTGEELQIDDEKLIDETFDVELDDDLLEQGKVVILDVSHDECGSIFEQIDITYANQSAKIRILEMKDEKKIQDQAQSKEIDL